MEIMRRGEGGFGGRGEARRRRGMEVRGKEAERVVGVGEVVVWEVQEFTVYCK